MDTGFVLDLFKRTTDEEDAKITAKKREKQSSGPVSQKSVLQGVGDLHSEDEYQGLDLAHFMESLSAADEVGS